ncbi:MAG: hypothetical protein EBV84_05035, partial [Betaproteobacteria bacterium]|nr:hypothetical protein [Betaproteobacteria bacterium]
MPVWLAALGLALSIQQPVSAQTISAEADKQSQAAKLEADKQSQPNKAAADKASRLEAPSPAKASAPAAAIAAIGPTIAAKAWVLYDVSSQQVLAAHEAEKTLDPASLTKLMTAYLSFSAIKEGRLTQNSSSSL